MSAIAGIVFAKPRSSDEISSLVGHMLDTMPQRGRDGRNLCADAQAGIGHLLLHTTPESLHEKLPLQRDTRLISSDARIDNRDELLDELGDEGRAHAEITDAELILRAYEKWGASCCEHLLGDFAFAIWDAGENTLFCGRDHFGVKPFYYYAGTDFFAFATELKALLVLPGVPCQLDETLIADLLVSIADDTERTFYIGIRRLAPAHALQLHADAPHEPQLQRYWRFDPSFELHLASDEEYERRFHDLFMQAVRCRMRCAFPVGAMLSGGLDSSSIAVAARQILRERAAHDGTPVTPLPTFSAVFDVVKQCDERSYINLTTGGGDMEPHYLKPEEMSPFLGAEQGVQRVDAACDPGNNHIVWTINRMAHECGVRILLDGFDGDTCVSHGIGLFQELAHGNRWLRLAREIKPYARRVTGENWLPAWWSWFNRFFLMPRIDRVAPLRYAVRIAHRLRRAIRWKPVSASSAAQASALMPGERLLNPEFASRIGLDERLRKSQQISATFRTEREKHFRALEWGVMPAVLEWKNHAAATFGVEVWFPFWDIRLAQFCLSLPPEQKLRNGYIRWIMRRGMEKLLPPEVAWRNDKSNLYPGYERGIKLYERERLKNLAENPGNVAPFVNVEALREMHQRFSTEEATISDVTLLCRIAGLDLWLQGTGLTAHTETPEGVTT